MLFRTARYQKNHKKGYYKEYHGSKSFDSTCRNHGTCKSCVENRTFSLKKELERVKSSEDDWEEV